MIYISGLPDAPIGPLDPRMTAWAYKASISWAYEQMAPRFHGLMRPWADEPHGPMNPCAHGLIGP